MENIKVSNFTFKYPQDDKNALEDVNFSVEKGEFVLICGKSGSGKSTLLRQLKKELIPFGEYEGEVLYEGENINDLDARRSAFEIGFVQQKPDEQIVTDKVWHELAFGLENLGMNRDAIRIRTAEIASYFGMQKIFRKHVNELSGGQKQLLNLASIMAMNPKLLLLDEPVSQLDPMASEDFLNTIFKINRDLGVTVIMTEHRLDEVLPYANKVIYMEAGLIKAVGKPSETLLDIPYDMRPEISRVFDDDVMAKVKERNIKIQGVPLNVRDGRKLISVAFNEPKDGDAERKDACIINNEEESCEETLEFFGVKPENAEYAIMVKNLRVRYYKNGEAVIDDLNVNFEEGKLHCILGGNGSGKSTFLKAVAGILRTERGKIIYKKDLRVSMLPQLPAALFTEISVIEELEESLEYVKISKEKKRQKVVEIMDFMELRPLALKNPCDLSGGEQQKLALAKILLLEPDVLLLDEPTKGMDREFRIKLGRMLKSLGITIIMASHDLEFCAEFGDFCELLFDGFVQVKKEPRNFFSENNFYTTIVNRLLREYRKDIVKYEEAAEWLKQQL